MAHSNHKRINRAIELLEADHALYYDGPHTGHVLTREQGRKDAKTWADYINVGMEHGAFDMTGLENYMRGLIEGGPTNSGHLTPAIIVEPPVNGTDGQNVAFNAWQFRQLLARGVHGILLCQAETADAVKEFVRACRFPHHKAGADKLGVGSRGRGSEPTAAPIWGLDQLQYFERAEPWPLNPKGELLLGVKIESPKGVEHCEEILAVPGLGFAELGPGDLGLSLGYTSLQRRPYPPEMEAARAKVFAACRKNKLAFLEGATPENIAQRLDEGVRVISGHNPETATVGRAHQKRTMPV
ncbi:MAG TPA: aldolase/citrate lyase family protein [Reyranella sp.]|nr:aldolase/citrate lyase family protein [Reyranella sp.]